MSSLCHFLHERNNLMGTIYKTNNNTKPTWELIGNICQCSDICHIFLFLCSFAIMLAKVDTQLLTLEFFFVVCDKICTMIMNRKHMAWILIFILPLIFIEKNDEWTACVTLWHQLQTRFWDVSLRAGVKKQQPMVFYFCHYGLINYCSFFLYDSMIE